MAYFSLFLGFQPVAKKCFLSYDLNFHPLLQKNMVQKSVKMDVGNHPWEVPI